MLTHLQWFEADNIRSKFLLPELHDILLGKSLSTFSEKFKIEIPTDLRAPGLPRLNSSQKNAIKQAFNRVLTLIQVQNFAVC